MATIKSNRRALLTQIRKTDQKIIGIYERAAEEMARKAGAAKADSLTERWARDYEHALRDVIGDMRQSLYGAIHSGAQAGANLPATATMDWLGNAARRAGMDESFRSVLSSAPTGPLRAMLQGRMYSDGRSLSDRIWTETGRLKGGIEEVVAQGIAQKRSAFQIARDLENFVNPLEKEPFEWNRIYPGIPFPLMTEYNAQRLARTSINHAYWASNKEVAKLNPLCQGMQWLLSPSHQTRQVLQYGPDICDTYAEHDEGLGKGVFPIDKLPMPHPQCLCNQVQVVPEMADAVDRLNHWLDGGHDPALTRGFNEWKKDNVVPEPKQKQRFLDAGNHLKITNPSGARIDGDVVKAVETIGQQLTGDFPVLNRLVGSVHFQAEPGLAAFGTGFDINGVFQTGIALDPDAWKSLDSLHAILDQVIADGHTKGTDDPMFIFSHEAGHALQTALALQDAGYELGSVMTPQQKDAYRAAMDAIAQEVFTATKVFQGRAYDTAGKIYQAIEDEMGWRGKESGELIAQAVAMVYNGSGEHPIADSVVQWLKGRLK